MREHYYHLKTGITRTPEFERKGLATHAVNVGLKCGHDCCYCSSPSLLRCHPSFKEVGENPFGSGYCIVDPETPKRVARDVHKLEPEDVVMLSTTSDPWAPEAQRLQLGDQCAEIILRNSPATIAILTKNAAVIRAFELLSQYRDRVWSGLSITAPRSRENLIRALEPNASSISERLNALHEAHRRGLRTYGMLCPCLPGIADNPDALEEMFESDLSCGAQNIWLEPVNPRGNGLVRCVQALSAAGFNEAASAIDAVRNRARWNEYAVQLIQNAQRIAEKKSVLNRLHLLLYANQLSAESTAVLRAGSAGNRLAVRMENIATAARYALEGIIRRAQKRRAALEGGTMQTEQVSSQEPNAPDGTPPKNGRPPLTSAERLDELVETYGRNLTLVRANWHIVPWLVLESLGLDAKLDFHADWQVLKKFEFGELGWSHWKGFEFHCEISNIPDLVRFVGDCHIRWRIPLVTYVTHRHQGHASFYCHLVMQRGDDTFARTCKAAGLTRGDSNPSVWELRPTAEDPEWLTARTLRGGYAGTEPEPKVFLELRFRIVPGRHSFQQIKSVLESASFRHNGGPIQCLRLDPQKMGEEIIVVRLKSREYFVSHEAGLAWVQRMRSHLKATLPCQGQLMEPLDSAVAGVEEHAYWGTIRMYFQFDRGSNEGKAVRAVVERLCKRRHALILECCNARVSAQGNCIAYFRLRSLRTWPLREGAWAWTERFRARLIQELPYKDRLIPIGDESIWTHCECEDFWLRDSVTDEALRNSSGWMLAAPTAPSHVANDT